MAQRSIARRAGIAASHALLRIAKKMRLKRLLQTARKRRLKRQIAELEREIGTLELKRTFLREGRKTLRGLEEVSRRLGDRKGIELLRENGGGLQDRTSDVGAQQSRQEETLKRKRRQLRAIESKK